MCLHVCGGLCVYACVFALQDSVDQEKWNDGLDDSDNENVEGEKYIKDLVYAAICCKFNIRSVAYIHI